MNRPKLPWLPTLIFVGSIGFIIIKEIVDPSRIIDLKIDKVRYGDLPSLTTALELFVQKHGRSPDEIEGLSAIVCSQPSETDCIYRLSKDPWLHPYVYRRVAEPPGYIVYSIGVNGIDEHGGGDDIVMRPKHYTCREYGVGCTRAVALLEFGASALAILSVSFLVLLGGANLVSKARKVFE